MSFSQGSRERSTDGQVRRVILTQISLQVQTAANLCSVGTLSIFNFNNNKNMKDDSSQLTNGSRLPEGTARAASSALEFSGLHQELIQKAQRVENSP